MVRLRSTGESGWRLPVLPVTGSRPAFVHRYFLHTPYSNYSRLSGFNTYLSTYFVFLQTLFMQLPRLVFLAAALAVIACFMSCFTVYHAYLVVTNQTTNERYKRYYLRKAHNTHLQCHPFSRGVVNNILEEVLPLWSISNKARVENARENSKNGPRAERKKKR